VRSIQGRGGSDAGNAVRPAQGRRIVIEAYLCNSQLFFDGSYVDYVAANPETDCAWSRWDANLLVILQVPPNHIAGGVARCIPQ
jgi:hypothetical protein